jgi:curved DNA-binding protein CbpA
MIESSMAYYNFTQFPPGKLLIKLLNKKFTGFIQLKDDTGWLKIYFVSGMAVKRESDGFEKSGSSLEDALLSLFSPIHSGFNMENSDPADGDPITPLCVIKKGISLHYTKGRLIKEAKELIKLKLALAPGFDPYIPYFEFTLKEEQFLKVIQSMDVTPRELADKTSSQVFEALSFLYALACTNMIVEGKCIDTSSDLDGLSEEACATMVELREDIEKMKSEDLFERFAVSTDVTTKEVDKIFRDKARKFHPDIFSKKGLSDFKKEAEVYFEKLTETYNILHDEKERKKLTKETISKEEQEGVRKILEAEMAYQKGMIFFRRKSWKEAEEQMKIAVTNSPDDGSYLGLWAWITYCNPANNKDAIRDSIKKALIESVELTKREANLHYYLGKVLADGDQFVSAKQHLTRAVTINPEHIEAAREMRLMDKKKIRDNSLFGKTGAFSKIFKKK